jgi:hypothetical protein
MLSQNLTCIYSNSALIRFINCSVVIGFLQNIQHHLDEYLPAEFQYCLDALNFIVKEMWIIGGNRG